MRISIENSDKHPIWYDLKLLSPIREASGGSMIVGGKVVTGQAFTGEGENLGVDLLFIDFLFFHKMLYIIL